MEADSLRVEPLGRDAENNTYWYFYGTRLYKENVDKPAKENKGKRKKQFSSKKKKKFKKKKKMKKHSSSESDSPTSRYCTINLLAKETIIILQMFDLHMMLF